MNYQLQKFNKKRQSKTSKFNKLKFINKIIRQHKNHLRNNKLKKKNKIKFKN